MVFRGLMLPLAVAPVLLAGCASTSSYLITPTDPLVAAKA